MLVKSQVEKSKESLTVTKKSRGLLVMDITQLLLWQFPVGWTAEEIATQLRANVRTVRRILQDMTTKGLLGKKYHIYTINLEIIKQIYGGKWYVKQETDKSIMLTKQKQNRGE
ncbi:MAG: hypothetical protein FWH53_00685 [Leptospirales bacterium]|nr:hypothetical protein [Leptospirales bacterium]